jgi:hypothetical protein
MARFKRSNGKSPGDSYICSLLGYSIHNITATSPKVDKSRTAETNKSALRYELEAVKKKLIETLRLVEALETKINDTQGDKVKVL